MRFTTVLASASLLATNFLVASPSLATVDSTLDVQFPNAVESHLVKHHAHLYSINEQDDGGIKVQIKLGLKREWVEMDADHEQISNMVADTTHVDEFAVFKEDIYMATRNTEGVSQVWKMCKDCRPAKWRMSGEAGFGEDTNTKIIDLFSVRGHLYALTENENGVYLYQTDDGSDWAQIGEDGLGFQIMDAVGVTRNLIDDVDYLYLGTSSGAVYRATVEDPTTWSLVTTLDGEITALFQSHVALTKDGVAKVMNAEDGMNYVQVGEDGLGNTDNIKVTRFFRIADHWFAVTKNTDDGTEIRRWDGDDDTWNLVNVPGFGDADNTQVTTLIKFRDHRFASTVNETNGAGVFKLNHTNP